MSAFQHEPSPALAGKPSGFPARLVSLTEVVDQPLHRALGLTDWELERIRELLGRTPNDLELGVFSLLWSEHCGYKHSAPLLKRLPAAGPHVLQGPGGNAGVIALNDGEAVAFKVESHNHPSAVEPFQGAATGVGGILRDVVAMGARPIALLDGLRFGEPGWEFDRAVAGIGAYGNSVGVPTVGGDTVFDPAYSDNCLVNAMCVGLLPAERVTLAGGGRPGDAVVLFGATTGRDGIGGASVLASQELGDADEEKRPSVQIGDPFPGKKLIEASLELVERGLVHSLQDLGAAGLASALAEMARDGTGIDLQLDGVPLREPGLAPWEIMLSESQERMAAAVPPDRVEAVEAVCEKWELAYARIGAVTETGRLRALLSDAVLADIPARVLTEECPRYRVEVRPPPEQETAARMRAPANGQALLELLGSANIASRAWVYRRYDHLVGSRTVRRPGLDAAVLRLRPSLRGLALSLDGSGRVCRLDPHTGGAAACLEAARNVACAGGRPLAFTDCLNFGNPEKPEIGWQLSEAIEGMATACEVLAVPVVSGNVSLYNETAGRPIHPTPVVGCVGLVSDVRRIPGRWREGDVVLVVGAPEVAVDGSEYQALYGGVGGRPAPLDVAAEAALVEFLWRAAPLLSLAHDAAEGGLAVACAEAAIWSGIGAEVELPSDPVALFGEGGGQAVIACSPSDADRLPDTVPVRKVGVVGGERLGDHTVSELRAAWEGIAR